MKRALLSFIAASTIAAAIWAAPRNVSYVDTLGPTWSQTSLLVNTVTIPAPSAGVRNCLTHVYSMVSSSSTPSSINLNILDVGTTVYTLNASTGTAINVSWPDVNPLCIAPGHAMLITGRVVTTTQVLDISYTGYTY